MGRDKRRPASSLRVVRGASAVIEALMEAQGVTKAELARRVKKSRAYVTQSLSGERNMTLRTFAGFADALDADVVLEARPRDSSYGRLIPKQPGAARGAAKKGADHEQHAQRRSEEQRPSPRKPR